jgi:hypothetical protein
VRIILTILRLVVPRTMESSTTTTACRRALAHRVELHLHAEVPDALLGSMKVRPT